MRGVRLDPFIALLLAAATAGTVLPVTGEAAEVAHVGQIVAIGLLFFLYGARLSTAETLSGLARWRLHTAVLGTTYLVFPALGLLIGLVAPDVVGAGLATGVLLLCLVPSTVQSSVAYTSIAGGNVAGAVVSASVSNLLGVFATPLLIGLLMSADAGAQVDASSVLRIMAHLLAPFVAGQLLRRWIGDWVARHDRRLKLIDRGGILLVVYLAFSRGREADVWSQIDAADAALLVVLCLTLLAVALAWTTLLGRLCRFERGDQIALTFCGSHKSLASGLPMAAVIFAPDTVALVVLPLMLYHQFQLIACAYLADRWSQENKNDGSR
ncbi:MAG: bile acid:sodium symporter family protein [Aeromicrobium sp.]|uniref:bile acid:sodium symporter family protein n=1 Tax=Aeromicrobium sp. TaxID=1871063 RepID=UPI0039E2805C